MLTDGVIPSLHIDYKNTRIKQYFKQVPAVREVGARTETTINYTRDFSIGHAASVSIHLDRYVIGL